MLLLAARSARASPEDLFGFGTRTNAMGATGVTHAQGWESVWHNPALASTIRENKLTLGWGGATFGLDAGGTRLSTRPAKGYVIGADVPLPFGGALADRVGLAFGFYTPSDVVLRGRVLYPERPQFPLVADRAQSLTVRAALGADIGWGLRVGIGVAALAEIEGSVVAATDASGHVGTRVEDELVATYAPTAGATFDVPGDAKVRVGVAFRGKLDARFSVVVDGSKLSSLAIPLLNISGLAQYDPAQLAIEAARVDALSVLALQLVYKRWSDYPGLLEPTVVCAEGGVGACGLVPPAIPWRDTFVVRIGSEQAFELAPDVVLRARGGAFLETSALPDALPTSQAFDAASKSVITVPTRYYDSARLAFTTGLGVATGPLTIDGFVQYHLLLPHAGASGHIKVFGLTSGLRF